jgi:hypothetical protein
VPEEDVLGDRQLVEEDGLLMDRGDAGGLGLADAVETHRRAVDA